MNKIVIQKIIKEDGAIIEFVFSATKDNGYTVEGILSLEEMKNAIKEYINSNKLRENEWICGRGWNHDYFNDVNRFPTKDDLDEISTEYPICIIRLAVMFVL